MCKKCTVLQTKKSEFLDFPSLDKYVQTLHILSQLLEYRGDLGKHFIHDFFRQSVYFPSVSCAKIKNTRLIASNNTCGLYACDWKRKPDSSSKFTTTRDWANDWQLGYLVELCWRNTSSTGRLPRCSRPSVGSKETRKISPRFILTHHLRWVRQPTHAPQMAVVANNQRLLTTQRVCIVVLVWEQ